MNFAAVRSRMNFQVSKKPITSSKKSDLASIWNPSAASLSIPSSSPLSSPIAKPQHDILSLLQLNVSRPAKKSLYCPPVIEARKEKKEKIEVPNAIYSNITFTANCVPEISDEIINRITFVYKGPENQESAWNSFKKVYKKAKHSVVASNNMSFHFNDGKVTAKASTQSAKAKLKLIATEMPYVDEEKAINLLDTLVGTERFSIFSSVCFNYSVVTPVIQKEVEMGTKEGKKHKVTFLGYMFPDFLESLEQAYKVCNNPEKCTLVLY